MAPPPKLRQRHHDFSLALYLHGARRGNIADNDRNHSNLALRAVAPARCHSRDILEFTAADCRL